MASVRLLGLPLIATLALFAATAGPASARGGYNKCGERMIFKGATKIIKEKGMRCRSATELASDYERKTFTRHHFPDLGEVRYVGRARCKFLNYYDPYEPAYVCVKTVHGKKKKMKALYPPERIG